jgi:deoxycytidylate deaminase
MDIKEIEALAISTAQKSICKKRKVGAVIVAEDLSILSVGYNKPAFGAHCVGYNKPAFGAHCVGYDGNTLPDVIHAEINVS